MAPPRVRRSSRLDAGAERHRGHGSAARGRLSFLGFTPRADGGPGPPFRLGRRFSRWFLALANKYQTPLAGGDLAESPVAMADIVLLGAVPSGKALLRSGARAGDLLCVTGVLGGAAVGLERLQKLVGSRSTGQTVAAITTFGLHHICGRSRALPRAYGCAKRRIATAAIDLSDGLSTDLNHFCQESGVSAEVDAQALPIQPGATLEQALHGGEDYELLFTVGSKTAIPRSIAGIPVTRIGRIVPEASARSRVMLLDQSGPRPLRSAGWQHFS